MFSLFRGNKTKGESEHVTSEALDGSAQHMREDRMIGGSDDRSCTESAAYSGRARTDYMTESRANVLMSPTLQQAKGTERNKRTRPSARRVYKRSARAKSKPKRPKLYKRKYRPPSASTISTRWMSDSGSSMSRSRTRACEYCGHRCCRRRFEDELRRQNIIRPRKHPRKSTIMVSQMVQAGSPCTMLSPLFISRSSTPAANIEDMSKSYVDVTPEMIFETLRRHALWRQYAPITAIIDDMRRYFPVNPVKEELFNELSEKLRIAAIVGFVTKETVTNEDVWCLNSALEERKLTKSHVSRFWKIYADTMRPVVRKEAPVDKEMSKEDQTTTEEKTRDNEGYCSNYFI